jgi:glycosyltransferase involved in cell wall biosynthesis
VKVWCLRSDIPRGEAEHVLFPAAEWLGPFQLAYFTLIVNCYGFWRWVCRKARPAQIIHATSGTFFAADVISVHFINSLWLRFQMKMGFGSAKEVLKLPLVLFGIFFEQLSWRSSSLRRLLAVSNSIADEMRRLVPRASWIETLPNSYDEARFNPNTRAHFRDLARKKFGIATDEMVFAFVSAGHYERKGFWLAADAVALVRSSYGHRNLKFLVIGGTGPTLHSLRQKLAKRHPDFRDWIVFTGMQSSVEEHLAAADAFLYPSYFEAFCLAEIEAAAMGIPLLITPHYGAEMILKNGVNGLVLEWDATAIAKLISHFVAIGSSAFKLSTGFAITRGEYARKLLSIYELSNVRFAE